MTITGEEQQRVRAELDRARAALSEGNDGKARVCARRAAGVVLAAHYRSKGGGGWSGDAQTLLVKAASDGAFSPGAREAAVRLTTSVTRRESLPFSTDPVADALLIISDLSGGDS